MELYDADPELHVSSWSPTPQADVDAGKPQAPSTQVHLSFTLGGLGKMYFRFKKPGSLDRLIAALIKHRLDVFGKPMHARWEAPPDAW